MKKPNYLKGASLGYFLVCITVAAITGYHFLTGLPKTIMLLMGAVLGALTFVLSYFIYRRLINLGNRLSSNLIVGVLALTTTLLIIRYSGFKLPEDIFFTLTVIVVLLLPILTISIKKRNEKPVYWLGILLPIFILTAIIWWFFQDGRDPFTNDLTNRFDQIQDKITLSSLGHQNPAKFGIYETEQFTYGSGEDKLRTEYNGGIKYKTTSVDGSKLLPEWKGKKKKWREQYWQFGIEALPLNGRVHIPKGEGPFPLIIIVHGNHNMTDHSDNGYNYLTELLASHGFISASVDENFLNGHWSGDFRGKEMAARAWLLLKHLEQWKKWNGSSGHDLEDKVDMERIILIGHSRGGEAVNIAAAFNKLPTFPDNALETFNFNFNIQGIITIAPTDYRYHRQIKLENVNYLSLQGSYDSDETSFWGMRPYHRLEFNDHINWFKAGVYIHGANHGQFNSTWGRSDMGPPLKWLLNSAPIITGSDQREAAKIFIMSFALSVFNNSKEYMSIFTNAAFAKNWLPENYYISQFQNSNSHILLDFEEDIDLSSGPDQIQILTQGLKIWREENLSSRDNKSRENNTVVLGWDNRDTLEGTVPYYRITTPDSVYLDFDSVSHLLLTLATGDIVELESLKEKSEEIKNHDKKEPQIDFTIELRDLKGNIMKQSLSKSKSLAPRLNIRFTKLASLDKDMIGKKWEVHPESHALPIDSFSGQSSFDFQKIKEIKLVFDITNHGVIHVDDIGMQMR